MSVPFLGALLDPVIRWVPAVNPAAGGVRIHDEGAEVRDIALVEAQRAELGKHLVPEEVPVRVGRRVGSSLTDLGHPDVGRVAEPGLGPQHLRALTALPPAARDPLATLGRDTDLAVLSGGKGGRAMAAPPGRVPPVTGGIDLRKH